MNRVYPADKYSGDASVSEAQSASPLLTSATAVTTTTTTTTTPSHKIDILQPSSATTTPATATRTLPHKESQPSQNAAPGSNNNKGGNNDVSSSNSSGAASSAALRTSTVPKDPYGEAEGEGITKGWGRPAKRFLLSLRFLFFVLQLISLVSVSVISWQLTLRGANTSLSLVTTDYSNALVTHISDEFQRRLTAAEHVNANLRDFFRSGTVKYTSGGDNSAMFRLFRTMLTELVTDTVSSISMTSSTGELNGNGWIFPDNSAPFEVRWDQTGSTLVETKVDAAGNDVSVDFTDPNASSLSAAWVLASNFNDQTAGGWTSLYVFYGNYFVSQSFTIYDPTPSLIGVITVDMQLGFINTVASQIASASTVGTQVVILDVATGNIIGTSLGIPLTDNSDPANVKGVYLFSQTSPPLLQALHDFIMGETDRAEAVSDGLLTPSQLYANLPVEISGARHIEGKDLLITVKPFQQAVNIDRGSNKLRPASNLATSQAWADAHSINWVLIVTIDRSAVAHDISASNTKVITSIICICIGFIIAMSLLLWYSMRLVNGLSFLLSSFARFEFRSHVESGQLKDPSLLTELHDLQVSAMEMTRAFKQHLDGRNAVLFKNRHHSDMVSPNQTQHQAQLQRDRSVPVSQVGDRESVIRESVVKDREITSTTTATGTIISPAPSTITSPALVASIPINSRRATSFGPLPVMAFRSNNMD